MAEKPKIKWWIPGVGLLISATLVTAGFGWSIDRATFRYATDALTDGGIEGVSVDNSYRDVTLTGPEESETAAVAAVEDARLVQDVDYVVSSGPGPEPTPSPSSSPEPSPTPSPGPSPEPTDTCQAVSPECMGGVGYLTYVFDTADDSTFAFDSASLAASDKETLADIAQAITDSLNYDPEVVVRVAGHTDSNGPEAYNQRLSETRAQVVRDYLVGQGVPAGALSIVGYGETRPIATNGTEAGRAANRRVELTIAED